MRRRQVLAGGLAGGLAATGGLIAGCGARKEDRPGLDYLSLAWQKESVDANKALVAAWNRARPGTPVRYLQGSWDTVHDQLLTSFEGGSPPDVIHYEANGLTDFAHGGYLTDLRPLLPEALKEQIPARSWSTARYADGIWGVPVLQEPRVLIADRTVLDRAGIRPPTPQDRWTWGEFEEVARELTDRGRRRYGVAWALKEPVAQTLNLALSTGGRFFYRDGDGRNVVRFGEADAAVPRMIRRQLHSDRTAARTAVGMSGSDVLPGFFAGRYAMVPLNFSYRQQIRQQAPEGFEWIVLPLPRGDASGGGGTLQGCSPQTLSVAHDSPRREAAMDFISHLARPGPLTRLARGDWLLPTARTSLADPALRTPRHGWRTGTDTSGDLVASPVLGVRGYPEWHDKAATPALESYYRGALGTRELHAGLVEQGNRILRRYQR